MKILLIDNGTTLLDKLQKLVLPLEIIKKWGEISSSDMNSHDLIIMSGSHLGSVFWNHADYQEEINLIHLTKTPVIGICFGCQLIAYAFGGELKELKERHQGIREIEILDSNFYAKPAIKVYESHRWVISKLPENFAVLARSEDGPEAIKHKNLPIYGLQFHPENFVDQTEGDEVFLGILNSLFPIK